MEYVANAKGQDIAVASAGVASTVQPASAGSNAAPSAPAGVPATNPQSAAATAISLVGLSTLEQLKDVYEREVARVEADGQAIKSFVDSVLARGHTGVAVVKTDVVAVESLPRAVKIAIGAAIVVALVIGFAAGKFL